METKNRQKAMKIKKFVPVEDCDQKDQCMSKYLQALLMAQHTGKLSGVPNCGSCKYRPQ